MNSCTPALNHKYIEKRNRSQLGLFMVIIFKQFDLSEAIVTFLIGAFLCLIWPLLPFVYFDIICIGSCRCLGLRPEGLGDG